MKRLISLVIVLAAALTASGCAWYKERAAFSRGVDLYHQGQWDGASGAFQNALDFAPRNADLLVNEGAARLANGDYWGALASFDDALQVDRNNAAAAFDRGLARARLGDIGGARLDWNHAMTVERDPAMREWMRAVGERESPVAARAIVGLVVPRGPGQTGPTGLTVMPGLPPGSPAMPSFAARTQAIAAATPPAQTAGAAPAPSRPGAPATAPPPSVQPPGPSPTLATAPAVEAPSALPGAAVQGDATPDVAARGVRRALGDDRAGALADLRAALARETDPVRRQRLEALVIAVVAPTPIEVEACNRQAGAALGAAPAPQTPAPPSAPATPPPSALAAPPPFSDADLLASADPALRNDAASRRAFLDCLRQRGF